MDGGSVSGGQWWVCNPVARGSSTCEPGGSVAPVVW